MSTDWILQSDQVIAKTYKRFPIVIEKGRGCTVWDTQGKAYTDFLAGIAVCNLGHCHPRITKALCSQAEALFHVSNLYYTIPQTRLAAWLTENSFADRVFFGNSGAEANEAAIKLARKYFKDNGKPDQFRIISMEKSFHGRTMATLSATGQLKVQLGYDPILDGFNFVPFNNVDALKNAITPLTCAVLMEPVQGEGGIRIPDSGYLKTVREICDDAGILLIFDEIQTGIGRTGKLFCHQHFGVEPDIMTLAKALGNGLPIGAMLAKEKIASVFGPGSHASTFGGTPIITAASLEVLKTLTEENLLEHTQQMGAYFMDKLNGLKNRHACIREIRGMGLLIALELDKKGEPIVNACLENGFIINCIQDTILRFAPPLIIETHHIDALIECLDRVID